MEATVIEKAPRTASLSGDTGFLGKRGSRGGFLRLAMWGVTLGGKEDKEDTKRNSRHKVGQRRDDLIGQGMDLGEHKVALGLWTTELGKKTGSRT